jgi:hypothetical protein
MLRKSSTATSSSAGSPKLRGSITEQHGNNSSPAQLNHAFINIWKICLCLQHTLFMTYYLAAQYVFQQVLQHAICEVHDKIENHIVIKRVCFMLLLHPLCLALGLMVIRSSTKSHFDILMLEVKQSFFVLDKGHLIKIIVLSLIKAVNLI